MATKRKTMRVSRIFRQKDSKTGAWTWYREYTNKLTGKREVRVSPCQNGLNLPG